MNVIFIWYHLIFLNKLYKAEAPKVNRFLNLAQVFNLVVGGGVIIQAPPHANYHPHDLFHIHKKD